MDEKPLSMTIFALLGMLAAFAYSFFYPTTLLFNVQNQIPLSILVIMNFLFGTVFFGYIAFIPSMLLGLQLGAQKNAAVLLYLFPLVISTYAGSKMGFALEADFWNKKNFLKLVRTITLILIVAIVIAIIIELAMPFLIEFWPKDTGLSMQQGETVMQMLQELNKFKR
jgi:hypothetical protein